MTRRRKVSSEQDYQALLDYQEKRLSPISDTYQDAAYGYWSSEVKAYMDLQSLIAVYNDEDWVWILVDRIASKIAALPLRVMQATRQDGELIAEPVEGHPVQLKFERPNREQTYYEFMYSQVANHAMAGNALAWLTPEKKELVHVAVETSLLDFDGKRNLTGYRVVNYVGEAQAGYFETKTLIPREEMAHTKRPNPSNLMWGLSPFIPGKKSVLFNRYSLEFLNNYYIKGTQPSLVIEFEDNANDREALRLLRSMELANTGRKNQRRNIIMPKGTKAKTLQPSLADQQLTDYISQNRETFINLLQVPKHELSLAETGSLGSEEHKVALRNFWDGPLKAVMHAFEESYTELFRKQLGPDMYLEFDTSEVAALKDDQQAKAELSEKMLLTHTLNEVRAKVWEEEALPGGDATPGQPLAAAAEVVGQVVGKPDEEPSEPAPGAGEDVGELVGEPEEEKGLDLRQQNLQGIGRLKSEQSDAWEQREKLLREQTDKDMVEVNKMALNLFEKQTEAALSAVKKEMRKQGFKGIRTKADESEFRASRVRREINKALRELEEQWLDETTDLLESTAEVGYDSQLAFSFNLPEMTEIEALRSRGKNKRRDILEGRGITAFDSISKTSTEKIMSIITRGVKESQTLQDIGKSIAEEVPKAAGRAMTIARTEVLTAASIGQAAAMQDAASQIPGLMKVWINAGDDRVRGNPNGQYPDADHDHWEVGGEMKRWDKAFSNGLQYPRDPNAKDAGMVVNCRCSWIMVPPEDAEALGISELQSEFNDLQGTDNR